jgi:hypothetical protein
MCQFNIVDFFREVFQKNSKTTQRQSKKEKIKALNKINQLKKLNSKNKETIA